MDHTSTIVTTQGQIVVRKPLVAWEGPGTGISVEANGYRYSGLCDLSDEEVFELAHALLIAAGMDDAAQAAELSHPSRMIER